MINTSNEYKKYIADSVNSTLSRDFTAKADIELADSTILNITEEDIVLGGLKINDATSANNSFQIGAAIINQCTLMLNNVGGKFDQYDFTDAIIRPYIGLKLSETTEWLKKGIFTVDEPTVASSIISLVALDNMNKFDTPFSKVTISFPCTQLQLLQAVCLHCGISLTNATFTNSDFVVTRRPNDEAITCREIVAWIAQNSGNFARCNTDGALELKWYDITAFEQIDDLDGGIFDEDTPYSSGDNADGGNFTDYNSGDNIDGGTFLETKKYHHIYALNQATIGTDDVVITGLEVKAMGTETDYGETVLFGTSGYVIRLDENPLITENTASIIANSVGAKIVGMRFRPCDISALSDPSREAGDVAYLSYKNNTYQILLTNTSYQIGGNDNISCGAETPSRKQSVRFDASTKAIVEARKYAQEKLTAYDIAVKQLNSVMTNAMGYYPTSETQEDGSTIDYMHDKPTLAESVIIWKKSIDGFAISDDGGITWSSGMTSDGNIIAKTLSAIGINAEWINVVDRFQVGTKFEVDKTGKLRAVDVDLEGKITADSGQIGPFRIDANGLKSNLMEFFENNNYPLIWLKKKGANGSEHGEGGALGNYEPSIVNLRSTEDDDTTSVSLMARKRADNNKKGTLSISNNSSAIDLDQDGLQILKYGEHSILVNKSGIHVSNDVLGGTCDISPYGSIVLNYGGSTFSIHNSLNNTSISTSNGNINFGDDLYINSKSGGDIILNGVSVNAIKQRLGL